MKLIIEVKEEITRTQEIIGDAFINKNDSIMLPLSQDHYLFLDSDGICDRTYIR